MDQKKAAKKLRQAVAELDVPDRNRTPLELLLLAIANYLEYGDTYQPQYRFRLEGALKDCVAKIQEETLKSGVKLRPKEGTNFKED